MERSDVVGSCEPGVGCRRGTGVGACGCGLVVGPELVVGMVLVQDTSALSVAISACFLGIGYGGARYTFICKNTVCACIKFLDHGGEGHAKTQTLPRRLYELAEKNCGTNASRFDHITRVCQRSECVQAAV